MPQRFGSEKPRSLFASTAAGPARRSRRGASRRRRTSRRSRGGRRRRRGRGAASRSSCGRRPSSAAGDDAVGGLVRLHLHDAVARAGEVRQPELLRDHAVEAGRLQRREPRRACRDVGGDGESVKPCADALELGAALLDRLLVHELPVPQQQVEGDEKRGDLGGQLADAALRRMQAHLHRVEVELAFARDHDLAVERRVRRQQLAELPQLREVAEQRPTVARPERELAAVVLEHAAEAVPLRLVAPAAAVRAARRRAPPPSAGTARAGRARRSLREPIAAVSNVEARTFRDRDPRGRRRRRGGRRSAAEDRSAHGRKAEPGRVVFAFRTAPHQVTAAYVPKSQVVESGSGGRVRSRHEGSRRALHPGVGRGSQRQQVRIHLQGPRRLKPATAGRCGRSRG